VAIVRVLCKLETSSALVAPWQRHIMSSPGEEGAGGYVPGGAQGARNGFPIFATFFPPALRSNRALPHR
jgi:hypothetical protein